MDKRTYLKIRKDLKIKKTDKMFFKHLFFDALLATGTISWCWYFSNSLWSSFAALGIFILMFRSFSMMHEAVHGVALSSRMNDWIGTFYGGLALLAFEPWKQSHLEHHYWSGNAEKDPVMALLIVYPKFPKTLQSVLNFGWKTWIPILAVLQHVVFWMLSIKKLLSSSFSWKMSVGVVWPLLFWTTLCWKAPSQVLFCAILPGLLIYLAFAEIVNLPHHLKLQQQHGETRLPIWDQYQSARTCVYPKFIEKFITLNFNYHTEHHMFPDVAWYQLSDIHELIKKTLGEQMNIDEQFAWTTKHRRENLTVVLANGEGNKEIQFNQLAPTGTQAD